MATTIQFLGGAGTVTGSKYLVSSNGYNVLVDCGMFQGLKALRLKNWDSLPVKAVEINAVILTHAHIDHSGYIPRLVKDGFVGRIYSTPATRDLCEILLPDAGYLAEEEANYLNKHRKSKHDPARPLFTEEDAKKSLKYFESVPLNCPHTLASNCKFEFRYVGHILGAASIVLEIGGRRIFFSGDIGRMVDPIFFPPNAIPEVDYIVTESTYGDRRHKDSDVFSELEAIVSGAVHNHGVIIVPTFAVGRAQEIIYFLWCLRKKNRLPQIPIYLNSPMATNVNSLFVKYSELHRLSEFESKEMCSMVDYVTTVEQSKALNEMKGPMLIISASGMVTGGRVLHHIKKFGPDERATILLTGFQAAGTRGEALKNGAREIKIHGEYVPIRAQVKVLENMSAHADSQEMMTWLSAVCLRPQAAFITHGEPSASDAMRRRISETLGWTCIIPGQDQKCEIK
ncbi:MAG: MBL fold metallo-hydrolase [Bdellovibrionales bacterium]|nr:MBL fold metallo-hydrolase [Bdellovibrionales bacterium]